MTQVVGANRKKKPVNGESRNVTEFTAKEIALDFAAQYPDIGILLEPSCRSIPAKFRPEIGATSDAWAVSFPYAASENRLPHHPPFTILVDAATGEVTIPTML